MHDPLTHANRLHVSPTPSRGMLAIIDEFDTTGETRQHIVRTPDAQQGVHDLIQSLAGTAWYHGRWPVPSRCDTSRQACKGRS